MISYNICLSLSDLLSMIIRRSIHVAARVWALVIFLALGTTVTKSGVWHQEDHGSYTLSHLLQLSLSQ